MEHLHAVILAGGSGTRLWPLSTPSFPKQFLPLPNGNSMIQETLVRVLPLIEATNAWVVTGQVQGQLVREHLAAVPHSQILEEPMGRNSAPAIAWAAAVLARRDPEAVMAIFSADHVITNTEAFQQAVRFGYQLAEQGHLVTWGIKPNTPETGYGYIRFADKLAEGEDLQAYRAERFVEKPDLQTAQGYLADGHYVWNSGMFIWKVAAILTELRTHLPDLARKIDTIVDAMGTSAESQVLDELWPTLTPISIDYGILEKTSNLVVIPVDIGWNDVGNWEQYGALYTSDDQGLHGTGHHKGLGSQNVFVYNNTGRQVYTIGLEDVIVIEMEDKTVICHRQHVQRVKELAETLQKKPS